MCALAPGRRWLCRAYRYLFGWWGGAVLGVPPQGREQFWVLSRGPVRGLGLWWCVSPGQSTAVSVQIMHQLSLWDWWLIKVAHCLGDSCESKGVWFWASTSLGPSTDRWWKSLGSDSCGGWEPCGTQPWQFSPSPLVVRRVGSLPCFYGLFSRS